MLKFDLKHGPSWVDPGVCSIFPVEAAAQGFGLIGDVVGGLISSSAAKKAAKQAEATKQDNNALLAAERARADATNRAIYDQSATNFGGYIQRGDLAGQGLASYLGLPTGGGGGPAPGQPGGQVGAAAALPQTANYAAYVQNNPDLLRDYNAQVGIFRGRSMEEGGRLHWQQNGQGESTQGRDYTPFGSQKALAEQQAAQQAQQQAQQPQPGQPGAPSGALPTQTSLADRYQLDRQNALQGFMEDPGRDYAIKTGVDAVNTGRVSRGLLRSGSALKALDTFGQDYANQGFGSYLSNYQNYQNNFVNQLQNLQGVGVSGAGSLAGVGQNFAGASANAGMNYTNGVTGNNDSAASAKNAATIGNANIWGNVLQQGAQGIGSALGSSYGAPKSSALKSWNI